MITKERVWETCPTCKLKHLVSDDEYSCDGCGKPIDFQRKGFLDLTVFHFEAEAKDYHFCSWACLFEALPKLETDYFIALPVLNFAETTVPGMRASDFWDAIKEIGATLE